MSVERYKAIKQNEAVARHYLSKIGRVSNATARHTGTLNKVSVETEIHFQPTDGALNYHKCKAFDAALAVVIQREFADLSAKTLDLLQAKTAEAARLAKDDLMKMQQELDAAIAVQEKADDKG